MQSSTDLCAFYTDMIKTLRITSVVAAILAGIFFVFPVIYGVHSDEQVFLFSIKAEFQSDLDNGTISEELRQEFEGSYSPLSQHADVSVKEAGSKWMITDNDKLNKYSISKAERGLRIYEPFEQFLNSPGVKDKFEDAADNKANTGESRESPLVEQAEKFASYLNPDKPTIQKTAKGAKTTDISSRVSVTPKFKVFGTSYCAENSELSQALIDEPGKGRYWVRQSSKIGHLLVEQVKDGLVVVKSSKETFEIEIEQMPETKSLNKTSPASSLRSSQSPNKSTSSAFSRAATGARRTTNIPQKLQRNGDDDEKMGELVDKLKDLQRNPASDRTNSGLDKEERSARIEELISKFKSTRVSAEEAKKLGNMGEELKGIRKDTNPSPPEADKGNVEVSPPKPDTSSEK
ncbi:MAG: hypothetical protein WBC05_09625 [Sedimentisphaerales bacterium]